MQGPRLLSHRAENLVTVYRAGEATHKDNRKDFHQGQDEGTEEDRGVQEEREPPRVGEQEDEKGGDGTADDPGPSKGSRVRAVVDWSKRHLRFLGPGLIASAAYIDPGNYATDLSAGATYGYKLLAIVLMSGLIGILMQILAARLGVVTGKDIAQLCRQSLHTRDKHPMLWRWGLLYPLYFIAEAGIIFTDLAELLGTATAFHLFVPKIPLWGGVLLTSLDVFIVLIAFNSYPSNKRDRSIIAFELLISALVIIVLGSFVVLLVKLKPNWADVFHGYVPSKTIVSGGALYISVGIIGATVMPHALFLGAKIATIQRVDVEEEEEEEDLKKDSQARLKSHAPLELTTIASTLEPQRTPTFPRERSQSAPIFSPSLHMPQPTPLPQLPLREASTGLRSVKLIRTHLSHVQVDIASSLFCFALVVNSAILIVASAAFYYGKGVGNAEDVQDGNLFSAFDLIKQRVGQAFAYMFALALMMSGQAASITATLAGQVVSEGFIEWRTTPWKRRLITRMIGMVPSLAVSASVGEEGVNTLLVASQVTLCIVLPFVMFPLLWYTSSLQRMSVPRPVSEPVPAPPTSRSWLRVLQAINPFGKRTSKKDSVTFANNYFIMALGWAIFVLVVIADIYALVELGRGDA